MMNAHEWIEECQRPKADKRQLMAVNGTAHGNWQEVVDDHVTRWRNPQPDNVMQEQTMECRVIDSWNPVRNDKAAEDQV